jgi:hypothetical protein
MTGRRVGFRCKCTAPLDLVALYIVSFYTYSKLPPYSLQSFFPSRGSLQRLPIIVAHLSKDTAHDDTIYSVPRRGHYTYAAVDDGRNSHSS